MVQFLSLTTQHLNSTILSPPLIFLVDSQMLFFGNTPSGLCPFPSSIVDLFVLVEIPLEGEYAKRECSGALMTRSCIKVQ